MADSQPPRHPDDAPYGGEGVRPEPGFPAAWYDDPEHPDGLRWWDGKKWTEGPVSRRPGRKEAPTGSMHRRGRAIAIFVAAAVIVWLFLPAIQGYHIGGCSQTDYDASATALQQQQGATNSTGYVSTVNRLFAWCKAITNPADVPGGG